MLRDQHFSSLFRHYGKHNGVDKETLVFFFTEELMQELMPSDTPRSVHLRKNDVIVIRHRRKPETDGMCVRLDLVAEDALALLAAFPKARSLASSDGRTPLHHVAARGADPAIASRLLVLGCDPRTLDNYGWTAMQIADSHHHRALADILRPNEYKKQMAVIRAQLVEERKTLKTLTNATTQTPSTPRDTPEDSKMNESESSPSPGLTLKRSCLSSPDFPSAQSKNEKHVRAVWFLFSTLAHGNQARNFNRVVSFLYA